jgi:hypothetical protein
LRKDSCQGIAFRHAVSAADFENALRRFQGPRKNSDSLEQSLLYSVGTLIESIEVFYMNVFRP